MKRTVARRVAPRRTAPSTVDEYFVRVPEPGRSMLTKLRAAIRSVLPRDATDIISYQIPAFARDGVIVTKFKDELTGYKTSKGTVQFSFDKPLPVALIKRIVKSRLAEHEAKRR